jgi:hypothetical protein
MFQVKFVGLASTLAEADPAVCDRAELARLVTTSQQARDWLDALDARIARRADQLADLDGGDDPEAVLGGGGRRSGRDAAAAARRGEVCAHLPTVHDALAGGELSSGHVDALARLADNLDDAGRSELTTLEPALVASAREHTVEEFARQCRELERILSGDDGIGRLERQRRARRLKRWVDRTTGMCHTHLELDPESDARVSAALNDAIATERAQPDTGRSWNQLQADAMVGLLTGARAGEPRPPELTVVIDLPTLTDGLRDGSLCETSDGNPLPPATIRRLACDADIIPVVLGGHGEVLDVGRSQRLATRTQRRALRATYRTCAHPDCTVTFDHCRIHHVEPWEQHGATDLANLLPLCSRHHHQVHEGGWSLTLRPDRIIALTRPDGTRYFEGPSIDRASARAAPMPSTDASTEGASSPGPVRTVATETGRLGTGAPPFAQRPAHRDVPRNATKSSRSPPGTSVA